MISAKNVEQYGMGVNFWFKKVEHLAADTYREMIWDVFKRITRSTPQWSGKAVANWNLSIGSPDFTQYVDEGDEIEPHMPGSSYFGYQRGAPANQRGDRYWINVALARARPVRDRIRYRDKVFICNGVVGDDDDGASSEYYLQDLQKEPYWRDKLREANRPYETAQESLIIVATQYGRRGFDLPRVGGESLD
jgi:hypothetical protein